MSDSAWRSSPQPAEAAADVAVNVRGLRRVYGSRTVIDALDLSIERGEFVALLGAAIASADQFAPRVTLSQFAAMITSDENTYFIRSFDALGVAESDRHLPQLSLPTVQFQALMLEAARSQKYANCLAVLCVAEGLYLDAFDRDGAALPPRFEHAEWIHLHANDFFRGFVAWLRAELDRVGEGLDPQARAEAADFFARAVALEQSFFDHVYPA